ncbi:DUF788-domain-containing protein [Ramicandelaber brevisporus]|nr:DUF788-domain-containing protein [Ramicandelaber brevisporus]
MANASAKRIYSANQRIIKRTDTIFLTVNFSYILYRLIINFDTTTSAIWAAWLVSLAVEAMAYVYIWKASQPKFSQRGELVYEGADLSGTGIVSYCFDIMYVTWFVHLSTMLISEKLWMVYLCIPVYAAMKLGGVAFPMLRTIFGGIAGNPEHAAFQQQQQQYQQQQQQQQHQQPRQKRHVVRR